MTSIHGLTWVRHRFTPLFIKFAPPAVSDPRHPNYLREHILFVIISLGVTVGGLIVFLTVTELISRQFWLLLSVVIAVYLSCVFIFLVPKLPFVLRSSFVCVSLYVIGLSVLFSVGPFAASREWFFSFCIVSSLFLGWTGAFISLVIFTSTLITIGITIKSNYWEHLNITSSQLTDWFQTATDSFFLAVTLTILVTYIFQKLEDQIIEHQITESKLIRNEATLESFINNIPGRAFLKDEAGRYILANRQVLNDHGAKDLNELLMRNDFEVSDFSTANIRSDEDYFVRNSGQPITFEETKEIEGDESHFIAVKFPIESNGNPSGLVGGIAFDITDKKKTESELAESQKKYRLLADNVNDNIW
jgi:PAS domain-containing protein